MPKSCAFQVRSSEHQTFIRKSSVIFPLTIGCSTYLFRFFGPLVSLRNDSRSGFRAMSTERYYLPGSERASRVRALFDRIAPRYDLINDLQSFGLHRFWKRRLLALANLGPGMSALDVCCGTGDLALAISASGARVFGCDFSDQMLAVAKRRTASKANFIQADALALPMKDESFD